MGAMSLCVNELMGRNYYLLVFDTGFQSSKAANTAASGSPDELNKLPTKPSLFNVFSDSGY
jgi:hypothetical protein